MNKFVSGLNETQTENGRKAYHSTTNFCLDLFYKIGGSRGKDITNAFELALKENPATALKVLLWARDIRGGAGERENVRVQLKNLASKRVFSQPFAHQLCNALIEVGRYDDLKVFWGSIYEETAARVWFHDIKEDNGLAAKWAPRKDKKGAKPLRKVAVMTEGQWRKFVVARTEVVEQLMCAGKWDQIDYNKLPSVASSMYRKAYSTHDAERYVSYLNALTRGDKGVKANAGAIYPYQAIKNGQLGEAQWKALPDYIGDSKESFLPIIDSSGSMWCSVGTNTSALDVAVSLGLYCAERNKSAFKDVVMTFAGNPQFKKLTGTTLARRVQEVSHMDWDMSTNIDKVYGKVLNHAIKHKVTNEDLPTKLLIVSDMQFNRCIRGTGSLGEWRAKFENAGYDFPMIVFWQVNAREGSIPVTADARNVALVSGFSPSIMTSLLGGGTNPIEVMNDALSDPRYDVTAYASV